MKLLPRARAVQINKLRLGDKDIRSIEDLKKNFYVSEILELGENKFTKWLERFDKNKAFEVRQIFTQTKDDGWLTLKLLGCFFPSYAKYVNNRPQNKKQIKDKYKNLVSIMRDLMSSGEFKKIESLLKIIKPNLSMAFDLMNLAIGRQQSKLYSHWLKGCALQLSSLSKDNGELGEFCYRYYKYLKAIGYENPSGWLKEAKRYGNPVAIDVLKEVEKQEFRKNNSLGAELNLNIRGLDLNINMIRVEDTENAYYISTSPIPISVFKKASAKRLINQNRIPQDGCQYRETCDEMLQLLSNNNEYGFKFDYQTKRQYKRTKRFGKFFIPLTNNIENTIEWCESLCEGRYAVSTGGALDDNRRARLRVVINMNEPENEVLL